ncbi:MAG: Beta-lactamase domain protein [Alphaproteobacteria bacterium]|nr:Beta-lactamase domain protein [Alphaproteobacteria bacterium]
MTVVSSRIGEDLLEDAARIMGGALTTSEWFRSIPPCRLTPLDADSAVVICRGLSANITVLRTPSGLIMADTGAIDTAAQIRDAIRQWEPSKPVHTIVYTHGHFDHCNGTALYDAEAKLKGWTPPRVIAHADVRRRFQRYERTASLNSAINKRQYSRPAFEWPTRYRYPDQVFHDELRLEFDGEPFHLFHGRGETDDHTWLWAPRRRLIAAGDFVMWAAPNAGNPQKAQRYALDWSVALRAMIELEPEFLIPGHGPPLVGAGAIRTYLEATARWLETLHDQTVALLNDGYRVDEIVQRVRVPADLAHLPWLQPTYDDPEFVVRNVCRLYGGWWDGNPAHLKPATEDEIAASLASVAGSGRALAQRAANHAAAGELRLAGHLVEWAALAAPTDPFVHQVRAEVNDRRAEEEPSQMAKGIFRAAARDARSRAALLARQGGGAK